MGQMQNGKNKMHNHFFALQYFLFKKSLEINILNQLDMYSILYISSLLVSIFIYYHSIY